MLRWRLGAGPSQLNAATLGRPRHGHPDFGAALVARRSVCLFCVTPRRQVDTTPFSHRAHRNLSILPRNVGLVRLEVRLELIRQTSCCSRSDAISTATCGTASPVSISEDASTHFAEESGCEIATLRHEHVDGQLVDAVPRCPDADPIDEAVTVVPMNMHVVTDSHE